jgi:hypothetical protein
VIALLLLGCAAGTGTVQVDVLLSSSHSGRALEGASATVGLVSVHDANSEWRDGWVDATAEPALLFGEEAVTLAQLTLPTGRYDHVSIELDEVVLPWVCGDEPTVAVALEPIAAPFRLRRDDSLRLEVMLLALADLADPKDLTLFAIDTQIE